jgi:sugar (pentulose or hexulose) kinase
MQAIVDGKTSLGIELGSTRIKAVLIGEDRTPLASGTYDWENRLENGVWTYHLDEVWTGIRGSFDALAKDLEEKRRGAALAAVGAIGISAMMHGYLAFDKDGGLLAPFRTWRNTITEQAAAELSELFRFNIPQRWSIAHLYQAILNKEDHVKDIAFLTTLAGYVHWKLSGEKVLGVGDASGMFPVDSATNAYHSRMLRQFNERVAERAAAESAGDPGFCWKDVETILPKPLPAGESAGFLSEAGAKLLDPMGRLQARIPLCPPEGDAGTGMVATNSVTARTGNISAGTSVFAMIVLERELSAVYPEIDMVATPAGKPVAMVHCNSCTSDLDAWVGLFGEVTALAGVKTGKAELYDALYGKALDGEAGGGGLLAYNYYSGEPVTGLEQGRPLFVRTPDARFTLANFMRVLLYSTMGTLKLGMNILTGREQVRIDRLLGHGGLFKTKIVGQRFMAAALNVPVAVMESAGEGGAWGIALLADYMLRKENGETLEAYLEQKVFAGNAGSSISPDQDDVQGFGAFMERYVRGLAVERAAAEYV